MDSPKSNQSNFAKSPEVLNSIDMILDSAVSLPSCKFTFSMLYTIMSFISKIKANNLPKYFCRSLQRCSERAAIKGEP